MNIRVITAIALCASGLSNGARAASRNVDDMSLVDGKWYRSIHAEKSYTYLENFLCQKKQNCSQIKPNDFYSALDISVTLRAKVGDCFHRDFTLGGFISGFWGNSEAAMIVVSLSATKQLGARGTQTVFDKIPLFYAGKGVDPTTHTKSPNTCFFDAYPTVREPYVRFDGGPNQDVSLIFYIDRSNQLNAGGITQLTNLLTGFAGVAGLTVPGGGGGAEAISNAAAGIRSGVEQALTSEDKVPITDLLGRDNKTIRVTTTLQPTANGGIVIYVRRSASIILDELASSISAEDVLGNEDVAAGRCLIAMPKPDNTCKGIAAGQTFRQAYKSHNKTAPASFFDLSSASGKQKIIDTCKDLTIFSQEDLRLTRIDELLIRWAVLNDSSLYSALKDPEKRATLAKSLGIDASQLDRCWSPADEQFLSGVIAGNHTLVSSP